MCCAPSAVWISSSTGRDPDIDLLRYMDDVRAKEDKLFERPELMRTPVVRNGRKATVGYCPDVWKQWEESEK